jgi:hypothetical protein
MDEVQNESKKLNYVAWVRERTKPTERLPLVGEVSANFLKIKGCLLEWRIPYGRNLGFIDRNTYFFFQVALQLYEALWSPFQTHYFSENLVAPGIEARPLDL